LRSTSLECSSALVFTPLASDTEMSNKSRNSAMVLASVWAMVEFVSAACAALR